MNAVLYRHYDQDGCLLYIGVSLKLFARLAQHKESAKWFLTVCRIDLEHHPDMKSARRAENLAITNEKPMHNKIGAQVAPRLKSDLLDAALTKAIEAIGSVGLLADSLGITKQAVSAWDRVPAERAKMVAAMTGVPLHELRPDIYDDPRAARRR